MLFFKWTVIPTVPCGCWTEVVFLGQIVVFHILKSFVFFFIFIIHRVLYFGPKTRPESLLSAQKWYIGLLPRQVYNCSSGPLPAPPRSMILSTYISTSTPHALQYLPLFTRFFMDFTLLYPISSYLDLLFSKNKLSSFSIPLRTTTIP